MVESAARGELCDLRWRAVDLARGGLQVEEGKTDASRRSIDLSPDLLDELKLHKAASVYSDPDDLVLPHQSGTRRERGNVRTGVLNATIVRANRKLVAAGRAPVQEGVTNHTCRRTLASLLYEAGALPAYVIAQLGHTSSALALDVYAKKMERQRDTGARMDALIRGADWVKTGTNHGETHEPLPPAATESSV